MKNKLPTLLAFLLLLTACMPVNNIITITNTAGSEATFTVEVADTDDERRQGLMDRSSMPITHGMLFVFTKEQFVNITLLKT